MSSLIAQIGLIVILLGGVTNCYYHRKNDNYSSVATVTPHFSSINAGIIQPKCVSCHNSSMQEKDFSNYAGVQKFATPFNASSSSLYQQVENGTMPVDEGMLSDDEILAIFQWIQNGALND